MNYKYSYKLGHQKQLSEAEFRSLCPNESYEILGNWLFTNRLLNSHLTGGLQFGCEVIGQFENGEFDIEKLASQLEIILQKTENKKLGLCFASTAEFVKQDFNRLDLEFRNQDKIISLAKKIGFKKINFLLPGKLPNAGNLKESRAWLFLVNINEVIYCLQLINFADQDWWSFLDTRLPQADIKRGMINFKLARSMANMAANLKLWDPMCGLGRNLIAAIDLKTNFVASDIDEICVRQTTENFNFSKELLAKWRNFKNLELKPGQLETVFQHDLQSKTEKDKFGSADIEQFSIVTEGYLGNNKANYLSQDQVEDNIDLALQIWQKSFLEIEKLGISEIVFCLPFNAKNPEKLDNELQQILPSGYAIENLLESETMIYYQRPTTVIGHAICKVAKKTK